MEERLVRMAVRKNKAIYPCGQKTGFASCFTRDRGRMLFWYNTIDHSTHVVCAKILRAKRIVHPKRHAGAAH